MRGKCESCPLCVSVCPLVCLPVCHVVVQVTVSQRWKGRSGSYPQTTCPELILVTMVTSIKHANQFINHTSRVCDAIKFVLLIKLYLFQFSVHVLIGQS